MSMRVSEHVCLFFMTLLFGSCSTNFQRCAIPLYQTVFVMSPVANYDRPDRWFYGRRWSCRNKWSTWSRCIYRLRDEKDTNFVAIKFCPKTGGIHRKLKNIASCMKQLTLFYRLWTCCLRTEAFLWRHGLLLLTNQCPLFLTNYIRTSRYLDN